MNQQLVDVTFIFNKSAWKLATIKYDEEMLPEEYVVH